jgi:hypothetical protein
LEVGSPVSSLLPKEMSYYMGDLTDGR